MGLFWGVLSLVGAGLFIAAETFKTPDHPRWSWNPKKWVPVWKQKRYYRPPGFWMMIIGLELFCLGALIITFVYGWEF